MTKGDEGHLGLASPRGELHLINRLSEECVVVSSSNLLSERFKRHGY